MSMDLEAVEVALERAAAELLPRAALSGARLHAAVTSRSRRYTSERVLLAQPAADADADLAARALFFGVADAAKVGVPLGELVSRDLLPAARPLRVCDLGAGAGAMTLGTAAFLAGSGLAVDLEVTAIDRDAAALALLEAASRHLAGALGGRIAITRHAADLARADLARGAFDLVLAGTVLNELPDHTARVELVTRALAALSGGGALVIIEPALRETSRDLHRVRDDLLARGDAHVFAPCTRAVAPCPALADPRDWCHEDRPLALPPRAAQVAVVTGLRDDGMKLAYLVLRRGAEPLAPAATGGGALRIVSPPTKLKGRRECIACGAHGWATLRLLTRHRDDANRAFERARRGDVVIVDDRPFEPGAPRDIAAGEAVDLLTTRRIGGGP